MIEAGPDSARRRPLPVVWLLGHRQVALAARSLASFARCCRDPFALHLFSDGSLTAADVTRLRRACGIAFDVHSSADVARERERVLASRPNLRRYYQSHPLAKKLVDLPLCLHGPKVLCDTDVIFRRPFAGLDHRGERWQLIYMLDHRDAYSIRWRDRAWGRQWIPLPARMNTGLLFLDLGAEPPWDLFEDLLGRAGFDYFPQLAEQTCWAALAGRPETRAAAWDEAQVRVPTSPASFDAGVVAFHFTSDRRSLLEKVPFANCDGNTCNGPVAELRVVRQQMRTPVGEAARRVMKILRRASGSTGDVAAAPVGSAI